MAEDPELRELHELMESVNKSALENKLPTWKPTEKQWEFLNDTAHRKALVASNQCLSCDTILEDAETGERFRVGDKQDGFTVWSWDGKKRVKAQALPPVSVGTKNVYSVEGVEVSDNHMVLTSSGWGEVGSLPRKSSLALLASTVGTCPTIHVANALRLMRIALDSRFDCLACSSSHDEPLQTLRAGVQSLQTSPAYALANTLCLGTSGDLACGGLCNRPCQSHDRLPTANEQSLPAAPLGELQSLIRLAVSLPCQDLFDTLMRLHSLSAQQEASPESLALEEVSSHSCPESAFPCESCSPDNAPELRAMGWREDLLLQLESSCQSLLRFGVDRDRLGICLLPILCHAQAASCESRVVHIDYLSMKECFEIEVPGLGNYFVGDILHHNCGKSQTTMYELALHLTGLYPPNWKGIRFDHAIEAWHIGVDIAKNIGTIQKSLLGDIGEWGTGYIPKKCLMFKGEDLVCVKKPMIASAIWKIKVKHVSGGWSNLEFMANTQDRKTFQSNTIDLIVFDEEPPDDVHSECVIRILVKKGYILYAFTPLEKEYHVWDTLAEDPEAKIHVITMYDCPWHDEKSIATVRATCHTESEAQARIYGIPNRSSGRIFDFDPCEYSCKSFELPAHWPRLGGIDIGYNHPTGCVALAWDRDQNIVYVYQEFKERGKSAVEISKTIRHWGVDFACSHDAFNHNMATTDTVADVFESEGIHVFAAGKDPWARIERVRSLISEGRLYIFKDRCPLLMQEMASYRTKDVAGGGVKIFKQGEDVVDAFTHAVAFYEKAGIRKGRRSQSVQIEQWEPKDKRYGI